MSRRSGAPEAFGRPGEKGEDAWLPGHPSAAPRLATERALETLRSGVMARAAAFDWLERLAGDPTVAARFDCNLLTGIYRLSATAAAMHGLAPGERGIMDVVSIYETAERETVLETLERATGKPMLFSYRARRAGAPGEPALLCLGRSTCGADGMTSLLSGYFLLLDESIDLD